MKDSYQKFADSMFGESNDVFRGDPFKRVRKEDLDEIRVAFAVNLAHLQYADNFRVYPIGQRKEYNQQAGKGCCGSWDSEYKCLSGKIYIMGCNYGH